MNIKLYNRSDIDDKKWNGCVHFAISAMPYAYTWYLDCVCDNWIGAVANNYKAVMPIVLSKKMGISYSFQPLFCQQLGVFSSTPLTKDLMNDFFSHIPDNIKHIDICLNESNYPPKHFEHFERHNYVLPLNDSYDNIYKKYSENLKRNIKKAENKKVYTSKELRPETFADFYKEHTAPQIKGFKKEDYYTMLRIIYQALNVQMGFLIGVYSEEKELIAANFFLKHPQRLINLMPSSNEKGKDLGAMHYLLDLMIKDNCDTNMYLDFEGSMIGGIAKFFGSFGAEVNKYYNIKKNKLPKILQFFKQ